MGGVKVILRPIAMGCLVLLSGVTTDAQLRADQADQLFSGHEIWANSCKLVRELAEQQPLSRGVSV